MSHTDSEEENSSKSTSTSATKPETSKEQSEKPTTSKIKPHDSSTAQSGFANVTSKTQSVMSETKSQNSSTTQTTSIKVTSTAPTYTDFFVCEYTIYLKREYADKQYTVSDFTNLPVKKLEGSYTVYYLFAEYTKKEDVLNVYNGLTSKKEVSDVYGECTAYYLAEDNINGELPSLKRPILGDYEKRDEYYDGMIAANIYIDDYTVWSVSDFPELSIVAVKTCLSHVLQNDFLYNAPNLLIYLDTLGEEARFEAAEKIRARENVTYVTEKYADFHYPD